MNLARIYLRASTSEQDATRARAALERFAEERDLVVVGTYIENESGAVLRRPELFRLLADSRPGHLVLVEGVDRLSRLSEADWKRLRQEIDSKQLRVVSMDLPTSWSLATGTDEFSGRMLAAVNGMMLDMLAAISRKDYEDRRRRQAEGIAKAKTQDRYKGRPENVTRNRAIERMLTAKVSWSEIQATAQCSRATVAKVAKRVQTRGAGVDSMLAGQT